MDDGLTKLGDSVSTRLATERQFGRFVRDAYRVRWIEWDSAFRDTDLQIGDLVVGLNGEPYTNVRDANTSGSAVGMYNEETHWERVGGAEGDPVRLTIVRGEEEFEIEGALRADRFYYTAEGRRALAPGGPDRMARDGFSSAWTGWYENIVKKMSLILDDGWNRRTLNNRRELDDFLEHEDRIAFLEANHPGSFAETMRADYERTAESLRGPRYELTDDDLAYRELGERRKEIAAGAADAAWTALLSELEGELVDPFPMPALDDRAEVAGKLVALPPLENRNLVNDLGRSYAVAGNDREGYYFLDLGAEGAQRFFMTFYRFVGLVNPNLRERYRFVVRVLDEPMMITYRRHVVKGLMAEVVAGRAGEGDGELFVDLRSEPPDLFAGESDLKTLADVGDLADDLPPEGVVETMIRAVQQADFDTWKETFAPWQVWSRFNEEVYVNRAYRPPTSVLQRAWEHSRRSLTKEVYDSRVSKVGPRITLTEANVETGLPRVEQVIIYVDHIGLFDGEYRAFDNVNVNRNWTLQRLDGGPWRISDARHL